METILQNHQNFIHKILQEKVPQSHKHQFEYIKCNKTWQDTKLKFELNKYISLRSNNPALTYNISFPKDRSRSLITFIQPSRGWVPALALALALTLTLLVASL